LERIAIRADHMFDGYRFHTGPVTVEVDGSQISSVDLQDVGRMCDWLTLESRLYCQVWWMHIRICAGNPTATPKMLPPNLMRSWWSERDGTPRSR
jgi:hypothetical protein